MGERVKDLVCGMEFDSEKAKATLDYGEKTYYFCSLGYKEKFEKAIRIRTGKEGA